MINNRLNMNLELKKKNNQVEPPKPTLKEEPKLSKYFTWKEALWLPRWNRVANESDGLNDTVRGNLVKIFTKMDSIRDYFGKPINVHCAYRPEAYNKLVEGAPFSEHKTGSAVDWSISGMDCDVVRQQILDNNLLEVLDIRMERKDGSNWVHNDNGQVVHRRYFNP